MTTHVIRVVVVRTGRASPVVALKVIRFGYAENVRWRAVGHREIVIPVPVKLSVLELSLSPKVNVNRQ